MRVLPLISGRTWDNANLSLSAFQVSCEALKIWETDKAHGSSQSSPEEFL